MNKKNLPLGIALFLTSWCIYGANTVTLDNQSGQPALVKLLGTTTTNVFVENGNKKTVVVAAGRFAMKARYGTEGKYVYSKGDDFEVKETPTSYSETTITLHKVVNGNYGTHPIDEKEFGANEDSAPAAQPSAKSSGRAILFQSLEIHDVAKSGDTERAKALIAADASVVNARDKVGQTPLHKAAIYGQKEFVKFLLANGAEINAADRNGYTPLYVAKTSGESDVAGFLEKAGGTDAIQNPKKPNEKNSKLSVGDSNGTFRAFSNWTKPAMSPLVLDPNYKFQALSICYVFSEGQCLQMGKLRGVLGANGVSMSPEEPCVWIFQVVPTDWKDKYGLEEGGAYLRSTSTEDEWTWKLIRKVDLKKTREELAAEFGVSAK